MDKNLFSMSLGLSEWASEQKNERKASSAEQVNEWAVRVNKRTEKQMDKRVAQ